MPKENAANRRDRKQWRERHGMRVKGRSVRDILSGLINWTTKPTKRKKKK